MTALSGDRATQMRANDLFSVPMAASVLAYAGAIICYDASGNATPGATATTLTAAGRAEERVDNSSGSAGDKNVTVREGTFLYANSSAGDQITRAEIGDDCYIVDDQTVAKTNGSSTRSVAGKIVDIDAGGGVWVKIGIGA